MIHFLCLYVVKEVETESSSFYFGKPRSIGKQVGSYWVYGFKLKLTLSEGINQYGLTTEVWNKNEV